MENNLESILERQIEQLKMKQRDGKRFMLIGFGIMFAFLIWDLFVALDTGTQFYLIYFFKYEIPQFGLILSLAGLIGHYLFSFIGFIIGIIGFIRNDRTKQKITSLVRQLNELKKEN